MLIYVCFVEAPLYRVLYSLTHLEMRNEENIFLSFHDDMIFWNHDSENVSKNTKIAKNTFFRYFGYFGILGEFLIGHGLTFWPTEYPFCPKWPKTFNHGYYPWVFCIFRDLRRIKSKSRFCKFRVFCTKFCKM